MWIVCNLALQVNGRSAAGPHFSSHLQRFSAMCALCRRRSAIFRRPAAELFLTCSGILHSVHSSVAGLSLLFCPASVGTYTCGGNPPCAHSGVAGHREKCRRSSFFFSPATVFCHVCALSPQISDFSETRGGTLPYLQRKSASYALQCRRSNVNLLPD